MYRLQKEKNINVLFNALIVVGLFMGVVHLAMSVFDMSVSLAYYSKANVASIAYLISQLLFLYIPLLLLIPNNYTFPKAMVLKWVFYGISLCYVLGNSWIIYYIAENSFSALLEADSLALQTFQRENALMFNYMAWNCYTPINTIFSFINAFLFFVCARTLEKGRPIFRSATIVACILIVAVPVCFKMFGITNELWISENIFLVASQICTAGAMVALSLSHRLWAQYLWSIARRKV